MKNATESKSARNPKAPEVTIENATTAALPTPTDAPAPPKPSRRKKAEPTVAAKAEVPGWAQRAAARDTAAEMATAPEAAPVAEASAPKKGRAPKPKATPALKPAPTATAGSLHAIGDAWLDSLRAAGHTPSTVSSYGNDLAIAYEHLGADTVAATITEKQIAAFNGSKGVTRKANGKPKAQPTILKTRRALRLALVWAEQKKLIAKAPYSAA